MNQEQFELSIVSPVYNEQEVLERFYQETSEVLRSLNIRFEIIFIDDGSSDRSFEILREIQAKDPGEVKVISFTRNFGHQLAITAGVRSALGRAVVVMDCDLQDPPGLITQFIEKWRQGYQVVYGVRTKRKGESFFKKISARIFYKFIRFATSFDIPENVGDFYLLDRKVVEVLNSMKERHRFVRGMIAWVGFKRIGIEYVRDARYAGKTKYGLWKMIKFSLDAATSFSFLPLRVISLVGFFISLLSFLGIVAIIIQKIFTNTTVIGWASLMVVVLFLGGIQLLAIGLIGEYVVRIGDDVKGRPLYAVKEKLG